MLVEVGVSKNYDNSGTSVLVGVGVMKNCNNSGTVLVEVGVSKNYDNSGTVLVEVGKTATTAERCSWTIFSPPDSRVLHVYYKNDSVLHVDSDKGALLTRTFDRSGHRVYG